MGKSHEIEQLRRDMVLATKMQGLTRIHEEILQSVKSVKGLVDENKRQLSLILNLPKGDRGERGLQGIRGIPGRDGKDGKDGKDGLTPQKGVDYLTKEDRESLILATLTRIRTPKDGENAVVDEEKIANLAIKLIKEKQLITSDHIGGLKNEMSSYRSQMALRQAGQHGGGDTIVAGSGITLTRNANGTTTIAATGMGSGSVTDVSVVSANGFAGTVATSTTTPAITLSTTVTGILKGNGTAISAAVANTDYQIPIALTTTGSSGAATFDGTTLNIPQYSGGGVPTTITVANEATDTSCFIGFFTAATGDLGPKTNANLTFNSNTGVLTAGQTIVGSVNGNAGTATALQNARTIGGVSFDGTANITVATATGGFTVSGGNLALGTNSLTLTGSIGATGARVTKGWFTDLEVTNAITGSITGNAGTVTTQNEATDTSCFISFASAASGSLPVLTNANMTFNSNTGVATFASTVLTTTDINGGTVDGTVIGGASAAAGTFTTATAEGFVPTSTTATGNRMYLPAANTIGFAINGTGELQLTASALSPISDDGLALGTTALGWQSLFGDTGFVLNIENSNWVATHTSGILTVGTGDLRVTNNFTNNASVVTIAGAQTLTNKGLTSPAIATGTYTGTQLLAEGASIGLDPVLSADGTWSGITMTATAGYTQAFGDLVYLDPTDSRWGLADANSASGADGDARGMLAMVVVAGTNGASCTLLLQGNIRADAKFATFTVNNPLYVSETAGAITQTQPTTTDAVIRIVGAALTADSIYFDPDKTWITHT